MTEYAMHGFGFWLDTTVPDFPVLKEKIGDEWQPMERQPIAMQYNSRGCDGSQCKMMHGERLPLGPYEFKACDDSSGPCRGCIDLVFADVH